MQKLNCQYKTDLEKAGLKVTRLLQSKKFQAFWVGGVVRNMLLKRSSDNIDIATDATPDQIEKVLNQAKIKNVPVGKQFGSILAIVNGQKIEITTFRTEDYYSDNRHPDKVNFIKSYLDDAKRRDFTINALYFDPITKFLYDPVLGTKDLTRKLLRFVGDPKKRIDEDALRMLRGVRLATELGFKLEKNSFAAIKTRAKYIQGISGERVKAELDKILISANRAAGLRLLDDIGLLKFIIPETDKLKRVFHKAKSFHLEGDMLTHTINAVGLLKADSELSLVYATLFHDIGKVIKPTKLVNNSERKFSYVGHVGLSGEIFADFAKRYTFPKTDRQIIAWLVKHHDDRMQFRQWPEQRKVQYLLVPHFDLLLELWRVDSLANLRIVNGKPGYQVSRAYVLAKKLLKLVGTKQILLKNLATGDLIMNHGNLQPGPELGKKILDVKSQIVLGKIKNEKDLKNFLKNP